VSSSRIRKERSCVSSSHRGRRAVGTSRFPGANVGIAIQHPPTRRMPLATSILRLRIKSASTRWFDMQPSSTTRKISLGRTDRQTVSATHGLPGINGTPAIDNHSGVSQRWWILENRPGPSFGFPSTFTRSIAGGGQVKRATFQVLVPNRRAPPGDIAESCGGDSELIRWMRNSRRVKMDLVHRSRNSMKTGIPDRRQ